MTAIEETHLPLLDNPLLNSNPNQDTLDDVSQIERPQTEHKPTFPSIQQSSRKETAIQQKVDTRQNFHQSQQDQKIKSVSQSPGNVRPRFSQYGLQNFKNEQSRESKLPRIIEGQLVSKHILSTSPQSRTTKTVKVKQQITQVVKNGGMVLMGKTIKQTEQIKKKDSQKIQVQVEMDKKSIFNNDGNYKFYVGIGNNEGLVKRVMSSRSWWRETSESNTMLVNFKWQQSNRGYRYERLIISQNYKQLVNHFEHHREISNKQYLLKNLTIFCEHYKLNVYDYTPLTFTFDFADENCDQNVNQFLKTYEQYLPQSMKAQFGDNINKYILDYRRKLRGHFTQTTYNFKDYSSTTKYKFTNTFMVGENNSKFLWLLKPTFLNRGRGIHVFSSLETLVKLIQEYQEGYVERSLSKKDKTSDSDEEHDSPIKKTIQNDQKKKNLPTTQPQQQVDPNTYIRAIPAGPCVIKSHAFVVQKYIERPALINQRKFDVRVWSMITHELDAYFFPEGYIRTSCESFDPSDTNNQFIHLTNNAIQKYSENYGQFESGNQLSWKAYQEYLNEKNCNVNFKDIIDRMKELVWMTFLSVKRKINFEDRKFCFEIFGFDFIIDENHQVWLIEVNTNPCIEESSPLLQILIPRMLGIQIFIQKKKNSTKDDAFKLTLDILFPKRKDAPTLKVSMSQQQLSRNINPFQANELPKIDEQREDNISQWPVQGYSDDENMWLLLGTLSERRKIVIEKKRQWRSDLFG